MTSKVQGKRLANQIFVWYNLLDFGNSVGMLQGGGGGAGAQVEGQPSINIWGGYLGWCEAWGHPGRQGKAAIVLYLNTSGVPFVLGHGVGSRLGAHRGNQPTGGNQQAA